MKPFSSLFGIDHASVQKNCLLLPFLPPGALDSFNIKKLSSGVVFASANTDGITIIRTGMGAGFVGDATLYLEDTPCENIFFLGSCGLVNKTLNLDIGDLVLPTNAFGFESFSDILNNRLQTPIPAQPDAWLTSELLNTSALHAHPCGCVSFASLHEEEKFLPLFQQVKADVIEMECAAFFGAAKRIQRKAAALLFVSDIPEIKYFHAVLSPEDKKKLANGVSQACKAILAFAQKDPLNSFSA